MFCPNCDNRLEIAHSEWSPMSAHFKCTKCNFRKSFQDLIKIKKRNKIIELITQLNYLEVLIG